MSTYPNLNIDQKLWKIKTRDDEIKNSRDKSEKIDYERILKSL